MKRQRKRRAHVLVWTIAAVALAGAGTRMVWVYVYGSYVPLALTTSIFDGENYGSIVDRAGLGPEVLAAAGVTSQQVDAIVDAAVAQAAQQATALASADEGVRDARADVDHLARVVQAGGATEQQVSALATARTALASAMASRATALTAVFNAGVAQMGQSQSRIATAIRANRSWGLPMHHLAASPESRTEADWVELREAIAGQLAEITSLRGRQAPFVAADMPTAGLTTRVTSAIAAAGLPPSVLANLSPDMDQPAGAARTTDGKPLYLRRSARITLESLTLPQLGRFLEAWRLAEPGWVISSIDLSPSSTLDGRLQAIQAGFGAQASRDLPLRALLTIEAVIAATATAPESHTSADSTTLSNQATSP